MRPAVVLAALVPFVACAGDDPSAPPGSFVQAGASGAGAADHAGASAVTAGKAGAAIQGGSAGTGGQPVIAGGASAGGAGKSAGSAGKSTAGAPAMAGHASAGAAAAGKGGAPATTVCKSHISYGDTWIHGADHPALTDDVTADVTWDGTCTIDGANAYATLSNGWKPYFSGHGCVLAIDRDGCADAPATCETRVAYGPTWEAAPNHPNAYDDIPGRVFWDAICHAGGSDSYGALSNGWAPHFTGKNGCELSFRYLQCGGLYENPVVPVDCPDPGVLRDTNGHYYLACTGGDGGGNYVIRESIDLVNWKAVGHIFPTGTTFAWQTDSFWAPEIHQVGAGYVAYYSARNTDGHLSIGAATAASPTGPFTDLGHPLVHDDTFGLIDVTEFQDEAAAKFLVWKVDGNAQKKPTPIYGRALGDDGVSFTGAPVQLITNDLGWEGPLVEGPFVVRHDGMYYLFYSANAYYNATYAVGVARSSNPLGPYEKKGDPILTTSADWVGPGHCSVVDGPGGDTYMVFHAWRTGHVNGPGDGRVDLVDQITWSGGWPTVPDAPSSNARPLP